MKRLAAAATLVAAMAIGPAGASAATEVGNDCAGDSSAADYTVLQYAKAPGGLPLTVPRSGVVTRWRVNAAAAMSATQILRLGVFRPAGGAGEFTTIAETADEIVVPGGVNSFEARIPVSVGDRFGTYGKAPFGPVLCATGTPGDQVGAFKGPAPVGSTNAYTIAESPLQVAVVATIEPDSDSDGFGDETQDKCPHNAALQALCPAVKLDITGLVKKSSVVLLVATSIDAPVSATATVKSYKLRAKPKLVPAGTLGKLKLKFPAKLKRDLVALEQGKSLKLRVEASAADQNGETDDDAVTVKLKAR